MSTKTERRKHPRIRDKGISLEFAAEGLDTITQSLDVSASGVYCKVNQHLPIMTRVQLVLSLPGKSSSSGKLDIEGVVVREHAVTKSGKVDHYDVAIFFNTLLPKERDKLAKYISMKLA